MNSIKNLFVVVMLMGVSYGAYHVISAPEPMLADQDGEIEELDIQIGPRTDEPQLSPPGLATDDSNSYPAGIPEFADGSGLTQTTPPLNPPELKMPELKMPELENPATPLMKDPAALANPTPRNESGNFAPPGVTPPPLAPSYSQAAGVQPKQNNLVQSGGAFDPKPETQLAPVTPKPGPGVPPVGTNEFEAAARDAFKGSVDIAQGFTQATDSAIKNRVVEPVRDAAEMLGQAKNEVAGRANELISGAHTATGEMLDSMEKRGSELVEGLNVSPASPTTASANINWAGINGLASTGKPREALQELSQHYDARLPQDQQLQMLNWLDLLAGKVIYSTEHLLHSKPYVVQPDDTLQTIADTWNIPAQLLYNVNQSKIADPAMLVPGTELKMIQGPFNAVVNLERQELTLFLDGMYAGRFPIELGHDGPGIDHGSFIVEQKLPGREYTGTDGQPIAAASADNPYGKYWIGLNENLAIHESNPLPGQQDNRGSIRLSSQDAADVFGILSSGSQVTIRR